VYVPLYPLAEWLATHWWLLFHELEAPRRLSDPHFSKRHSLRDAREGYALPPLSIHSQQEAIRFQWEPELLPNNRVEFLTRGHEELPAPLVREVLHDLINGVLGRLRSLDVRESLLEQEWTAINNADPEEQAFCAAAAALGLDPYSLESSVRDEIVAADAEVPGPIREEFFSVASASELGKDLALLRTALDAGRTNSANLPDTKELRKHVLESYGRDCDASQPWATGYSAARILRDHLNLDSQPLPSWEAIAKALGAPPEELHRAIRATPDSLALFDAVLDVNDKGSPAFCLSSARENGRRFHFCRALFEFLTSATLQPALLTRATSYRQARSRAFAAEFLAPASGLRERLEDRTASIEEVSADLAAEFGVDQLVILHQIRNHRLAQSPELSRI
jgi:hypothetical protein